VHRGIGFVVKDTAVFAVGIEHEDLVMLRAFVTLRPEVRVTSGEPDAAFVIDIDAGGRDERRMLTPGCSVSICGARSVGTTGAFGGGPD
jgi:hypothetical protein